MANRLATCRRMRQIGWISLIICAALAAGPSTSEEPKVPDLPEPFHTKSVTKHPKVIGWPEGKTPKAPSGFEVQRFAADLNSPRWLYVLPNGDVLVAESRSVPRPSMPEKKKKEMKKAASLGESANRITLFRDTNDDGLPDERSIFLKDLNQPFGMLLLNDMFYVANTDSLVRFAYKEGQKRIEGEGEKLLDLPAGGYNNHWTRNVVANRDGSKLYISVGSGTNVDEENVDAKDQRRAAILECDPDGKQMRVFAGGLRNPVGMDFAPGTDVLWTVVNERDGLGDDLVPDYLTSVKRGAFYGWPYSYFGQNVDPRKKGERPDLVAKAIVPDYPLGSHTASLGLVFYDGKAFPERYRGGAFIGQRGSWNRSEFVGYRVAFVPFRAPMPAGETEDFLTGFIANEDEVYGRPVGVAVARDGSLLVADDAGNRVWRVSVTK